jgi:hypothetical protein
MTTRTRNLAMAAVAAAALGTPTLSAAADAIPVSRCPTCGHRTRNWLRLSSGPATARRTFRGLLDTINASDSIVFVEAGNCGHGVPRVLRERGGFR